MAIPCTLKDDEEIIAKIRERFGDKRWMFIPNTLHVEKIFVSQDLAHELRSNPKCHIHSAPIPLSFSAGRLQLFSA